MAPWTRNVQRQPGGVGGREKSERRGRRRASVDRGGSVEGEETAHLRERERERERCIINHVHNGGSWARPATPWARKARARPVARRPQS